MTRWRPLAEFWAVIVMFAFAMLLALTVATDPAKAQSIQYDLSTTSVLRINLPASQAVTVEISGSVGNIVVADPDIADAQPVTDKSLYLVGKGFGTTTVNLYGPSGRPIGLIAVEVGADVASMNRAIRAAVPGGRVSVETSNGRVILAGIVPDQPAMDRVMQVVSHFASDPTAVVNTLTFPNGQQVNLQVRILEASRNAGRELGINWLSGGTLSPGFATGKNILYDGGTIWGAGGSNPAGNDNTFATFIANIVAGGINVDLVINALEAKGLVRTLAEPNLTTLSGQSADFLAGGEVPIRVADSSGNITLEYKDFGVKLVFTPAVLDDDRIQMRLTPEVSDITQFTSAGDPIFSTRKLGATVELRDGQSFSVAGLMQSSTKLSRQQLPWLGDVPIIGTLFQSSSFQKNETELVVIVTPRLVQPNTPTQVASSPLDATMPANDAEFFLLGQMEVTPAMIKSFEDGEGIVGPYGYIIDLDGTGNNGFTVRGK